MSRYIVYRWPRGRPSEVAQSDGDLRWVAADREMVSTLFRDDPHRRDAQLQLLRDGYVGLLCVGTVGWCAYAWMRRPDRPGPPHLPASARRPSAYWITYCRTRRAYQRRGLFKSALRRLVAVASSEHEAAEIYVDAEADNDTSHRGIVAAGFARVGVVEARTAGVPKVGRVVVGHLRMDSSAYALPTDPGRPPVTATAVDSTSPRVLTRWVRQLIGPVLTGRFGRGVLVLSGGTAMSQALIVLASPLLTRAYTPADFGVYGAALSLITFLTVASSLRYERAIPLPEDEATAVCLVALCLLLVAITTSIAGVVLFVAGSQITSFLHAPSLEPILWVVLVAQVGAGTYQVMNGWAVRARAYAEIARTRVSQSVATLAVQLGMGVLGMNEQGLVVGDAIGRSVGTGRLGLQLWKTSSAAVRSITSSGVRTVLIRYRKFGMFVAPASLLNSISLQIPSVMLLALYGPEVAGWYLLVQRIGAIPATLISASVAQVFLGEAARVARDDPSALPGLFSRTWRSLLAAGTGPLLLLAVLGPFLSPIVFGDAWLEAGRYLAILAPMLLLQFAIEPVTAILVVLERQGLVIIGELIRVAVMVGIWLAADYFELPPTATLILISAGGSASYLMYFVVSRYATLQQRAVARP